MRMSVFTVVLVLTAGLTLGQNRPIREIRSSEDIMALSEDGSLIATSSYDSIVIISLRGTGVTKVPKAQSSILNLIFSHDKQNMIVVYRNLVQIYSLSTKKLVHEISAFRDIGGAISSSNKEALYFTGLAGDSESNFFFTIDYSTSSIERFDISSSVDDNPWVLNEKDLTIYYLDGRRVQMLNLKNKNVTQVVEIDSKISAFDIDSRFTKIVAGGPENLQIINFQDKKVNPYLLNRRVSQAVFGSDDNYFICSVDNGLFFYDANSPKNLFIGMSSEIIDIQISSDDNIVATLHKSGMIKIWNNPWKENVTSPSNLLIASAESDIDQKDQKFLQLYSTEIKKDLAQRSNLFAPKDEFETTPEYQARVAKGEAYRESVLEYYRNKRREDIKEQVRIDSLEQVRIEAILREKVKNSYTKVVFNIDALGNYNADKEEFPITINGKKEILIMPREEARLYKPNYKVSQVIADRQLTADGEREETFNMYIIHPISTNKYPIGIQRAPLYVDIHSTNVATTTQETRSENVVTVQQSARLEWDREFLSGLKERKNFALIIGVDDYVDESINDLNYPTSDAQKLARVLTSMYNFDRNNVTVLENPTYSDVILGFDGLTNTVTERDNLLIFYAGHGIWDEQLQQGYWLPKNARSDTKAQWVSNSTIRDYIRGVESRHTLLIADACFSGGIFKTREVFNLKTQAYQELYKLPSRKAITSGTLRTVPDNSVFMKYLIKRLEENDQEILSSSELFSSFREAVIINSPTRQIPQYGDIRESGDEGGDFLFILKD